ncbi:Lysophospholipid acyltransferase 7 [Papilio xuthus]|uniref:Lysophospholipid acyltransferase 7 n=1 Tax=Papilio xuthus TaxID=66420 RepID=A0A194PLR5_PAPXU|nr:Lysophospholipid acyltransferase 7 [Papilio xuthus]
MVCGNVLILKSCDRRYVHQISLAYSWTYLLYVHHNVPSHSYMIGIFQIIALRLVGLACELSIAEKPRLNYRETTPNEAEVMPVPEAVDMLAYAYYFIGIHKALLGTAVCTESGFGLYPVKCAPLPGSGPSTHYSVINLITKTPDAASEQEYNVQMLNSFEIEKLILGPKMKDTMRGWDMSIRYWYWAYAYRKFIKANKQIFEMTIFMLWTLWCGPSIPQIIISTTLWVIIHLESEYSELYDTEGSMKLPWDIGFSIMRMFCLLYLTPCFVVDDTKVVLRYYNSIYWMFHIILFVLMFIAVIIFKSRGEN